MVRWTDCTISDICIDYLVKNSFKLYIERTSKGCVNEWDWIAERTDLHLCATDPVRLTALYMIHKDWTNKRKRCKTEETDGDYVSVFVGICESQELLDGYLNQDCSVFGKDFHILYDEKCLMAIINPKKSNNVEKIFENIAIWELDLLKQDYQDNLDKPYNTAIVIKNMKYEGEIDEILNDKFGYFKFLGAYPRKEAEYIMDYGNTYDYAVDKLVQWGYMVSIVDDSVEFSENCNLYIAEKNKKIYSATDPLRLLGLVAVVQEYGEDWAYSDVVRSFTIQPETE